MNCWYCGEELVEGKQVHASKYERIRFMRTRDHLTPISRGGDDSPENLVDACMSCNTTKGSMTLDEFRQFLFERLPIGNTRKNCAAAIEAWKEMPLDIRVLIEQAVAEIDERFPRPVFYGEVRR